MLASCYGCVAWRPHPALVAVAYFAQACMNVAATHVFRRLFNDELPSGLDAFAAGASFDELRFAVLTGIPVHIPVWFAVLFLAVRTVIDIKFSTSSG